MMPVVGPQMPNGAGCHPNHPSLMHAAGTPLKACGGGTTGAKQGTKQNVVKAEVDVAAKAEALNQDGSHLDSFLDEPLPEGIFTDDFAFNFGAAEELPEIQVRRW